MGASSALRHIFIFWKSYILFFTPLICLPLVIYYPGKEARCGYITIIMAIFWVTEAMPIPVTALIPVFAFPLLGVVSTEEICRIYMKDSIMMFLASLSIALAVEVSCLHKRIALWMLLKVGQSPIRLMAGFMMTTMFLSMWIANTSSTSMMVPIVGVILQELYLIYGSDDVAQDDADANLELLALHPMENKVQEGFQIKKQQNRSENAANPYEKDRFLNEKEVEETKPKCLASTSIGGEDTSGLNTSKPVVKAKSATPPTEACKALRDMLYLATAYGANLGGTGSLTGTGSNMILRGVLRNSFPEGNELTFTSWMMFNVPGMLLCGILAFLWLQLLFVGCGSKRALPVATPEKVSRIRRLIERKYAELGSMSFHEGCVLFWFLVIVLLWMFLSPGFMKGWDTFFIHWFGADTSIDNATPAMLVVFCLVVFPANPNFLCFRDRSAQSYPSVSRGCLTWTDVQRKIPWGILLLAGGGYAVAEAMKKSGLSTLIGSNLQGLDFMSPGVLVFVLCIGTAMATELTTNSVTASILLPVLKDLSLALCVNPLYLTLPAAVCCSYAFMLPVATPPNALVFGAANMETKTMIKAGFVLNILCVCVITFTINTLGIAIFDINTMPKWANTTEQPILHCW